MEYNEKALQTVRETRFLIDRYDQWIFSEFCPYLGKRILEVGCGLGNLSDQLLDRDLVVAIDICAESVAEVNRKFIQSSNYRAFTMSITDGEVLSLIDHQFDTCISLNVFEHIEDDQRAIDHTWKLLQPNGIFILIVPAHLSLYGTMDRAIGHYRRYTKTNLKQKLSASGFKILHQKYLNMCGALGWLVNGRLLKKEVPPSGQLQLINQIIPAIKVVENAISPPFGISLLTIAQKVE